MTKPRRLWRAMLYVPANVPRFVEKAPKAGADAVVLDLEDSVPYDRKLEARAPAAPHGYLRPGAAPRLSSARHLLRHGRCHLEGGSGDAARRLDG